MSYLDDTSALAVSAGRSTSLGQPEDCIETHDQLTAEQIVALFGFFDLLVKWESEDSNRGN
jgi:hypothetical protein